jgi:hypothetical protein
MKIDDPKIVSLRAAVKAAQEEFDMAMTFHEVWKPAAYDEDLHERMGRSYAANAFLVVRQALRRETLLALLRLWDNDPRSVQMGAIGEALSGRDLINTLAIDRVTRMGIPEAEDEMRRDMSKYAAEAIALIGKYSKDGSHFAVLEKLRTLRNKFLAHREVEPIVAGKADATDQEIEEFYQDNSKLVSLLLSVVAAIGYDPGEAAEVFQHYAALFWASARGERTEGHPNYRPPPVPLSD